VWRSNSNVRNRLGWAFAPESNFPGRLQIPQSGGALFIDHGIRNAVLRLDTTTPRWSIEGVY
jgi:hypothetical protein